MATYPFVCASLSFSFSANVAMILKVCMMLLAFTAAISAVSPNRQTYIVHMENARASDTKEWYQEVLNSITMSSTQEHVAKQENSAPQILYTYETVISGFSTKLTIDELESLKQVDGFLSATPDEMLSLHTTHSPQFLGLQQGKGLWTTSNLGTDVVIGMVDTGIWPEHVSFRDSGLSAVPSRWKGACQESRSFSRSNCNKKIIGARVFYKGYEAIAGKINETEDYYSPRDSHGHGTHTASIVAGNVVENASLFGLARGVASGMRYTGRIAVYKACWKQGCASTDVLAAMDQAVRDGVDVLSLSLAGFSRPFYSDNVAIASFSAVKNGVFVTTSAGNSGPLYGSVGNTAPWIMTVGASYLDRRFPTVVKLGNGQIFEGSSLYSGKITKKKRLVYGRSAGSKGAEYCSDGTLDQNLVKGRIVVCDQNGINSRTKMGEQVKLAGGVGMILLNTDDEGEELLAEAHVLPVSSIGATASKAIKDYLKSAKKPKVSIIHNGTTYKRPAPLIAAFSSRGPSLFGQEIIKPDVAAPGVNILAAWPPKNGPSLLESDHREVPFNILSGTSMACPHVSGLAALLKSVHKDWSPAAIKSALMTTAYTMGNGNIPIVDVSSSLSATPFAFGSGHVDPERASDPGLVYDTSPEDYLNYLCSLQYTSSQLALLSRGNFTCPSDTDPQPGNLNYPSFAVHFIRNDSNSRITYRRTVTNVGTPLCTYKAQINAPERVSVIVEPESLHFKKLGEKLSYKVSFAEEAAAIGANSSFGSLVWVCGKYSVRSPIAVTWTQP